MSFLQNKYAWLFKFFDHSQNGHIDISDFRSKAERATGAVKEFLLTQENGQDVVDQSLEAIGNSQVEAYEELFNSMVKEIDASADGQISVDEWKTFCEGIAATSNSTGALPEWFDNLLGKYFENVLDFDKNGAIDFYELGFMGDAPVELAWYCFDFLTDHGEKPLDKESFIDLTQRYMCSEDPEDPSRYMFGYVQN